MSLRRKMLLEEKENKKTLVTRKTIKEHVSGKEKMAISVEIKFLKVECDSKIVGLLE